MAVIEGGVSSALQDVDAGFKAARVSVRPPETLAWISAAGQSGALAGPAANTPVFSFRNLGANPVMVRRLGWGLLATTGFTAGQELAFGLTMARAFTVSDSGGSAIVLTGSTGKHRTSMGVLTSIDCRIASSGALTAGTRTLDAAPLAIVNGFAATGAVGSVIASGSSNVFAHDAEDYPIILAQNEGFVVQNLIAMGAGGVCKLTVNVELAEVLTF